MTAGTPSPARRSALLIALRTWLLPVALGGAAFGVHYAMHVPAGPLPPPSPAEIEEKKKAAEKKKKDDEKKQREEDRKAGKARPAADPNAPRELAYEPFTRPRDRYLLEQLWEYYEPKSFIKVEPVFEAWQTAHKPLVSQIVSATRQAVLPDGPAISVSASECHTIRCRFTITAPSDEPLQQMSEALSQLQLGGASLWHSFIPGKIAEEPSKREGGETKQKLEFTVGFIRDLPPLVRIELPGKGPLRTPPPPPRPTAVPGAGTPSTTIPGAAPTSPTRPGAATLPTGPSSTRPGTTAGAAPSSTRPGTTTTRPRPDTAPDPTPK